MQNKNQNNTDISERILQLIDNLGVNVNEFSKNLGYNRSQAIYDMRNGKAKPSFDFFYKLLNSEYSDIVNIEWIVTGRGDMLRNGTGVVQSGNINMQGTNNGHVSIKGIKQVNQTLKEKDQELPAQEKDIAELKHEMEITTLKHEIEKLRLQLENLQNTIRLKNELIEVLKNQSGK